LLYRLLCDVELRAQKGTGVLGLARCV